jgi:hypothetical protein
MHFLGNLWDVFAGRCAMLLVVFCFAAGSVAAQESVELPQADKEVDLGPTVESARVQVRSVAEWLASGVDSWFGNKPFSEGGQVSDGQLGVNLYSRQDQGTNASVRFNARFKLPNVESHTYLFTGRDNSAGLISDKPAAFDTKQQLLQSSTQDQAFFAGLGRMVSDSVDARVGFQGGLNLFAQGRFRRLWTPTSDDEFEFSQTFFATIKDRLGSSTTFSIQHRHSSDWVGRWLNAVTVTQADTDAEWNSSLGAYRSMGQQRLLSLEILASAKQNTGLPLTDYGVQIRWEQPVLQDRLIGEIVLGHFWPQSLLADQRSTAWAVGTGLKMRF